MNNHLSIKNSNFPLKENTELLNKIIKNRGFDIVQNKFFIEQTLTIKNCNYSYVEEKDITSYFDKFNEYYDYLCGDIYNNSCYYGYNFSNEEICTYNINIDNLNFESLINYCIDDFHFLPSKNEIKEYNKKEKRKIYIQKWIDDFNKCKNYKELIQLEQKLSKSKLNDISIKFFLFNFIKNNKDFAFDIIMDYINNKDNMDLQYDLCLVYNPIKILNSYNNHIISEGYFYTKKRELSDFINNLNNGCLKIINHHGFDKKINYFSDTKFVIYKNRVFAKFIINFSTFNDYLIHFNNDLSNSNLLNAFIFNEDFSKYKTNENTKLPIHYQKVNFYKITKEYDRKTNTFNVNQIWYNDNNQEIKRYTHSFDYLFDFLHFLKNDLSNANLLFCDGLKNINNFSQINFTNAKLKSNILDKLNIKYKIEFNNIFESFTPTQKNELETNKNLLSIREDFNNDIHNHQVFYISDLHLEHKLSLNNCKTIYDINYYLQNIIDNLLKNTYHSLKTIILIAGDTTSDFNLFQIFIKLLRKSLDNLNLNIHIIFTLGNHELWNFNNLSVDEIANKYENILLENKMYLLHNNIILQKDFNNITIIKSNELSTISNEKLINLTLDARLILFGGIAFSGYNENFNANNGIYKNALNHQQEIEETKNFEKLYNKISKTLHYKNIIILTHMPFYDWCKNQEFVKGFIYINGHTHRNFFYDDGDFRIYSDNQIGYNNLSVFLKYLYVENEYDIFENYLNGIYEITSEQYNNFNKGKNITINYNREAYKLYMLKKNNYYLFIHQSKNGNLNILNGGALSKLKNKDINYYYNNMDNVVKFLKFPIDTFTNYQQEIANKIKKIGGSGNIHGSIIDIDFFNHLFINPIDLKITAYYATDIINKYIYKDLPSLLENHCPNLYLNYNQLIKNKTFTPIILNQSSTILGKYIETDIYNSSREICKLKKITKNLLTKWVEPNNN